jgi:hypothetical protein
MSNSSNPELVDIEALCIPLNECISVAPGAIDESRLVGLESHGYDQAPVYEKDRHIVHGLVETKYLRSLLEAGKSLISDDPNITSNELRYGISLRIDDLLTRMTQVRAVSVVQESDASEYGHAEWVHGLVTISDLNKHPVRATLYALMLIVESGLARIVQHQFPEPWDWVKTLSEENQVRVLCYWELSKRKGVDVGPIAATTLSQLLQVVARDKDILSKLHYQSRQDFESRTGSIPGLRNCVMHPVRPIILDAVDVLSTHKTVSALLDLRSRIQSIEGRKIQHTT